MNLKQAHEPLKTGKISYPKWAAARRKLILYADWFKQLPKCNETSSNDCYRVEMSDQELAYELWHLKFSNKLSKIYLNAAHPGHKNARADLADAMFVTK